MQDPHDPSAAIRELRAQFVRGSARRLAVIDASLARLRETPGDREALRALRLELQSFSGLARSSGFPTVSKLGREGVERCDRLAKSRGSAPSAEDLSAWSELAQAIRKELGLEAEPA
jgi:hypothetical protein